MPRRAATSPAQILLFPSGDALPSIDFPAEAPATILTDNTAINRPRVPGCEVVLCGSFRQDTEGLKRAYEELLDVGCSVLSPTEVAPIHEADGFVFMKGEETETPERIELKHLNAIQKATFVWVYAPAGYVGLSAALEVGFAHAQGIPVFCRNDVSDITIKSFVHRVSSPKEVVDLVVGNKLPIPAPNVRAFQRYYKRVASQRGYERETAQNCLLLMVEEVGELARALRKREKLIRHGASQSVSEAHELADVFLYTIHMANILGLDLGSAVREKEEVNLTRFVGSR
ncbi:MAG: MazG nucleotide pyrophosphohydrolase domain-containing protein [Bryobacteraceae bacterium]